MTFAIVSCLFKVCLGCCHSWEDCFLREEGSVFLQDAFSAPVNMSGDLGVGDRKREREREREPRKEKTEKEEDERARRQSFSLLMPTVAPCCRPTVECIFMGTELRESRLWARFTKFLTHKFTQPGIRSWNKCRKGRLPGEWGLLFLFYLCAPINFHET